MKKNRIEKKQNTLSTRLKKRFSNIELFFPNANKKKSININVKAKKNSKEKKMKLVTYLIFLSIALVPIIEANHYGLSQDVTESISTSTQLTQKINATLTIDTDIAYKVEWSVEVHASASSSAIIIRVELDGISVKSEVRMHPNPNQPDSWETESGFFIMKDEPVGEHTITLYYASGTEGAPVKVRRAALYISSINLD